MASCVVTKGDGIFSAQAKKGVREKMMTLIVHFLTFPQKAFTCYLPFLLSLTLKYIFISQFNIFQVGMHVIIDDMPLFNWKYFFNW